MAELQLYLVGGAVRDGLLGLPAGDRDWVVVGATPQQMLDAGYRQIGKDFPVYLHPESGEEYALARTERKSGHGYTGFTVHSAPDVTLEEDLLRRDLTINAIAEDADGNLHDPYGGRADLEQRLLRHVSQAFIEDPLRVLRVARFAARYHHLGFTIATETLELMTRIARSGELQHLPAERIWQELDRALLERSPEVFFDTLVQCEALAALLPQWQPLPQQLEHLQSAAAGNHSAWVRFACLLGTLDETRAIAISARLRAPNQYQELVQLCCNQGALAGTATTPETKLSLLENCDAWRREQRFTDFLTSCVICRNLSPAQQQTLLQARANCHRIDTSRWRAEGVAGPEIGAKIRERRLQLLAEQADSHD